ncbi:hypothetical protein ABW20_dc0106717 [Dactylellina cionopaga]|nr:hypothetical protein ABW20_dc0106717 [Dactylellina cionopaga]
MDFVVSSYVSTVKALKFARARLKQQESGVPGNALLVTVSDEELELGEEIQASKGRSNSDITPFLLKMRREKKSLVRFSTQILYILLATGFLFGLNLTQEKPKGPSDSYLLLKHSDDERLTIADLTKVRHQKAQLVYLSACSTAEITGRDLADEIINMANAFQLAGYPNVIGTLWTADNESAIMISKMFYRNLLGDPSGPCYGNITFSLHESIKVLMKDPWFKDDYLAWTPFIHIGA